MNSLDTRFAQKLHAAIVEELNTVHRDLGSGTQVIRENAAATGMNCARYMGLISGLQFALDKIMQIDADMGDKKLDN